MGVIYSITIFFRFGKITIKLPEVINEYAYLLAKLLGIMPRYMSRYCTKMFCVDFFVSLCDFPTTFCCFRNITYILSMKMLSKVKATDFFAISNFLRITSLLVLFSSKM